MCPGGKPGHVPSPQSPATHRIQQGPSPEKPEFSGGSRPVEWHVQGLRHMSQTSGPYSPPELAFPSQRPRIRIGLPSPSPATLGWCLQAQVCDLAFSPAGHTSTWGVPRNQGPLQNSSSWEELERKPVQLFTCRNSRTSLLMAIGHPTSDLTLASKRGQWFIDGDREDVRGAVSEAKPRPSHRKRVSALRPVAVFLQGEMLFLHMYCKMKNTKIVQDIL